MKVQEVLLQAMAKKITWWRRINRLFAGEVLAGTRAASAASFELDFVLEPRKIRFE